MQSIGRLQRNMNRNGEIPFLFSGSCFELLRAHSFNVVCMQHSIKFALFLFFVHFLVCDTHQRMEIHALLWIEGNTNGKLHSIRHIRVMSSSSCDELP